MLGLTKTQSFKTIALIGNHPPRQCGIATFTADLSQALAIELKAPEGGVSVVAMNDRLQGYSYPEIVQCQISADIEADYLRAARTLNASQFDAVILQHEFGIFGGDSGSHILHLLRQLLLPLITTLHTVLQRPSKSQMAVMLEMIERSEYLVVMSNKAKELMSSVYRAPANKVIVIPHGVPDLPFQSPELNKPQFGFAGRKVCLTFGLLGPSKGIEDMIRALPLIAKEHPDVLYVILGATHPHIIRERGEAYRHQLHQLAKELGVSRNVLFCNQFVPLETLVQYLLAADIYVTPYINEEQIVSGTLAYSLSAGNAVVSTPYWYASELLADGRGCLFPFRSVDKLAESIISLFSSDEERDHMRRKAYQFSRSMTWKQVAREYIRLVAEVPAGKKRSERVERAAFEDFSVYELPEINLAHLMLLTDDTGILQHAKHAIPKRSDGYCTDDNARALIVCTRFNALRNDDTVLPTIGIYLAFLLDAYSSETGRFRNFMSYSRNWLEDVGSEDSHGRALWSLGVAVELLRSHQMAAPALELFHAALEVTHEFSSPRSWAFTIIGLDHYLNSDRGDRKEQAITSMKVLSAKLSRLFRDHATDEWFWPEKTVTYCNAKVPQALLIAGSRLEDRELTDFGLRALTWLLSQQTTKRGSLSIIGNRTWHGRDGVTSSFDQQPVDAMCLVDACAQAYESTGDQHWANEAERCFAWYLGYNDLGERMYDFKSGGCYDGMQPTSVNQNQGAEATLSFLLSLMTMYEAAQLRTLRTAGSELPEAANF